jgi:hypothetical protein
MLAWFDDTCDKGYPGIIGVAEVPDSTLPIFTVQRDSHPVLYDPAAQQVISKLQLADRRENPEFCFRAKGREFWAADYDSMVKLDAKTFAVKHVECLEDANRGTNRFIGRFVSTGTSLFAWLRVRSTATRWSLMPVQCPRRIESSWGGTHLILGFWRTER